MALISSVRGMRDLLPAETGEWRRVESAAAACFARYGYGEIRTPVVERAELFRRQLGENNDIVRKEMYAFADLSGDELCLRPEATVPAVRAAAAANLPRSGVARIWYGGPMFRRERPQKGRYRQFWQIGAEAIGAGEPDPAIDAEQILMAARLWKELKVDNRLQLFLNNLGAPAERAAYRTELSAYFRSRADNLDDSARARIDDNPMRILDSKDAATVAVAKDAPQLREMLGAESRRHLEKVQNILAAAGVAFAETSSLVRGLDYYNLTVFEWALKDDGRRQNALCGGGRYDGLSAQIGGPPLHGCGFALGLDRLVALTAQTESSAAIPPDCILLPAGGGAEYCARAAEMLRDGGVSVRCLDGGGNIGKQLKKADAAGSPLAAIVGEDEEKRGAITIKNMRDGAQQSPTLAQAAAVAAAFLANKTTEKNQ